MAERSNGNSLGYTNVSYAGISEKLATMLSGDPRFANIQNSSIMKVVLDDFAAMADLVNYYTERTAEESFLETARHLSSVIVGAKQIGYVPSRPVGSTASVSITLSNPDGSGTFSEGDVFRIRSASDTVDFKGNSFVFTGNYRYILTKVDADMLNAGGSITISTAIPEENLPEDLSSLSEDEINALEVPIRIMQGERKTVTLYPGMLAGKKWQTYKIDDPNFSNMYGSEDAFDSKPSVSGGSLKCVGNPSMFTRVFVKPMDGDGTRTEYHINRRSILVDDWNEEAVSLCRRAEIPPVNIPVCLVETNRDTTVGIVFGDGDSIALGPNYGEVVEVEYLSVQGSSTNQSGVIGSEVELNAGAGNFISSGSAIDFPGEISVSLSTNISGGSDFEDILSIKGKAPSIFQSLDRLVTKKDYEAFLRTLTSPIPVAFSTAWGEAEECVRRNLPSVPGLMNCALFTVLGYPYEKDSEGNWKSNNPIIPVNATEEQVADAEKAADSLFAEGTAWEDVKTAAYFDIFLKNSALDYINYIYGDNAADSEAKSRVGELIAKVEKHSQLTVKNIYIPPTVHFFDLTGEIVADRYCDIENLKKNIKNAIYAYLNVECGFGKGIHISNLEAIVQNFAEVKHCRLWFRPTEIQHDSSSEPAAADMLYEDGSDASPEEREAVKAIAIQTWRDYIEGTGSSLWSFYEVSNNQDNTYRIEGYDRPKNPYGDYFDIWSPEKKPTLEWRIEDYVYNIVELSANAMVSQGKNARNGTPLVYERSSKLADGFSKYKFYEGYFKVLYENILANGTAKSYLETDADFMHYIEKVDAMMEKAFCCSMLDSNGDIARYSVDSEFALITLDDGIVAQEDAR